MRDYFPLGIAAGSAFCNRKAEIELLKENIHSGKHTLLMATRRYGKSSLALQAIRQSGIPYLEIDFYMARSEKVIESYLVNGVVDLIGKTLGPVDKLIASIKKYVKHLKPKLDIGASAIKLELTSDIETDPATNVKEALLLLEHLLAEKKKRAVFFLDEFQSVGIIAQGRGIEGAIRHVAQKTQFLTFIFSGSHRRLLQTMFEDETRPLYKLCWKISLNRIGEEDYQHHIQKAAKAVWNQEVSDDVIKMIMTLTERHPFYVNKLCDRVWAYFQNRCPTVKDIKRIWEEIVEEERSDAIKDISLLSLGQKNVLFHLAKGNVSRLTSKQTMLSLSMTSSSILTALEALEEKDIIEKIGHEYNIINPILKFYVLK